MKWQFLIFLSIWLFTSIPFQQEGEIYYSETGHAEFTSSVPLHSFTGSSDHLTGMIDFQENLVDFYLDLKTLDTGNNMRDQDMYETLNVEEYPFAEFTGSLQSSFDTTSSEKQEVAVQGKFTIHGETHTKTLTGTLQKVEDGIQLQAEWVLDITNYDIEPPGILFYRVEEEMDVRIDVLLKPRQEENIEG